MGVPWAINDDEQQTKFSKLSFMWDASKEIEVSNVPDFEVDIQAIEQKHELEKLASQNEKSSQANKGSDMSVSVGGNGQENSDWNFEISEWDDSCIAAIDSNKKAPNVKLFEGVTLCSTGGSSNISFYRL